MEDVIGGHGDPERFARYLDDWRAILQGRVEAAVRALAAIDGVTGLILAGGLGRGEPWPLSDIDLIPIYDDELAAAAGAEVERRRLAMLPPWIAQGWWTGLDVGRLAFTRSEAARVTARSGPDPVRLLDDDRWYHSLDKACQSRAVFDPDGQAAALAAWFTRHRFDPTVVAYRLERDRREIGAAQRQLAAAIRGDDPALATAQLRSAVKWLQTWRLETWGERDNSQGRLGTRFEHLAREHGQADLADTLDRISDLDEPAIWARAAVAPEWVRERHDRSWRARRHAGEPVSSTQDLRDTLRVCSLYALRRAGSPPYPAWLAVPDAATLRQRAAELDRIVCQAGAGEP